MIEDRQSRNLLCQSNLQRKKTSKDMNGKLAILLWILQNNRTDDHKHHPAAAIWSKIVSLAILSEKEDEEEYELEAQFYKFKLWISPEQSHRSLSSPSCRGNIWSKINSLAVLLLKKTVTSSSPRTWIYCEQFIPQADPARNVRSLPQKNSTLQIPCHDSSFFQ
jgi:hypothetical protein